MIVFELMCSSGHRFETWFANSAAYDTQNAEGNIACPYCNDNQVAKAPMAPHVARSVTTPRANEEKEQAVAAGVSRAARALSKHVKETCDYVARDFPEEARRMHYGESEKRGIYGEASEQQAAELRDEGIAVHRIPWFARQDD